MSRFNTAVKRGPTEVNLAGGKAYKESAKLELVSLLLTSFLGAQFYRKEDTTRDRLVELMGEVEPSFTAKAALYARDKFGMRSITHVAGAWIGANVHGPKATPKGGKPSPLWTRAFFEALPVRVDDITETVSFYLSANKKPLPAAMKVGFGRALARFDDYQIAKYRAADKKVKLVDVVNLTHPVPAQGNHEALTGLIKDNLASTETWEAKLSSAGQKQEGDEADAVTERKAEAWAALVKERKIGYFALLRNLRNILEQAPSVVPHACALLADERMIAKSRVLPFRYMTAIGQLEQVAGAAPILAALDKALEISVRNVPDMEGRTCVVIDVSGSMTSSVSAFNKRAVIENAALFGAVLMKKLVSADLVLFDTQARYASVNPTHPISAIVQRLKELATGGGTDFTKIFATLDKPYDRIIILSDMQGWVSGGAPNRQVALYKARSGANPHIYSWDMAGYGTLMFPEPNVYALAGFSDKVFDLMKLLEGDRQALVHAVEAVQLG